MVNVDDFGSTHKVNDVDMIIIIDEDLLKERQRKSNDPDGYYIGDIIIQVPVSEYVKCGGDRPKPQEVITLDGKQYVVEECPENEGLYTITLTANF
jgi:hypothetical protein